MIKESLENLTRTRVSNREQQVTCLTGVSEQMMEQGEIEMIKDQKMWRVVITSVKTWHIKELNLGQNPNSGIH